MRTARIKEPMGGYYHVISRIVDRRMVLDSKEKERFRKIMRRAEAFSAVQVLSYAILDNHFHILLHVPPAESVSDKQFAQRLAQLYDRTLARNLADHLALLRKNQQDEAAEQFKAPYVKRMYDLSEFMKTLKQRFTQAFNHRHGRKGTLWEERFRSILVEGCHGALTAISAYIDLNAVRAGIVSEPGDYRYSGYGEALGGSSQARKGLSLVMQSVGTEADWKEVHAAYRKLIYAAGEETGVNETGAQARPGFSQDELQAVLDAGGDLTLQQVLHCRVRYFTDGLVLGTRGYVDDVFVRYKDRFGARRKSGARPMRGACFGGLYSARRLRLQVITLPQV